MNKFKSSLSQLEFPYSEKVSCKMISAPVLSLIKKEHPMICGEDFISSDDETRNQNQQQELIEVQKIQIEMMNDILRKIKS